MVNSYLENTPPEIEKLSEAYQELEAALNLIEGVNKLEGSSRGLVSNIKNPNTHNPAGILALYNGLQITQRDYERVKQAIGKGYEIRIATEGKEKTFSITPEIINHIPSRIAYLEKGIDGLIHIYRTEIEDYLQRGSELLKKVQ